MATYFSAWQLGLKISLSNLIMLINARLHLRYLFRKQKLRKSLINNLNYLFLAKTIVPKYNELFFLKTKPKIIVNKIIGEINMKFNTRFKYLFFE